MTDWFPLFSQKITLDEGSAPKTHVFSFETQSNTSAIRLKCKASSTTSTTPPEENVRNYVANFSLLPNQAALAEQIARFQLQYQSERGWAVLLFDPAGRVQARWDPSFDDWLLVGEPQGVSGKPFLSGAWKIRVISSVSRGLTLQVTLEQSNGAASNVFPIRYEFPDEETKPGAPVWLAGELHEHTSAGTGSLPPSEVLERYHRFGYGFVVLSDHDNEPLSALPKSPPPLGIIRGQEIETPLGHACLLGTRSFIAWYDESGMRDMQEIIRHVHAEKALFGVLHPYAINENGQSPSWRRFDIDWRHVDLLEIWHGEWKECFPEAMQAFTFWDSLLNQDIRVVGVCGKGGKGTVSQEGVDRLPKTLLYTEGLSETHLLSALKQGKCYSTIETGINFIAESRRGTAMMGEELQLSQNASYQLKIIVHGAGSRTFLRVINNTGVHCEMPLSSVRETTELKLVQYAKPGIEWFRIEIYRYGRPVDELLAFSNPVFIRGVMNYA